MSINSLMIFNAEGVKSSEYIANAFCSQNIAHVSSIILLPYLKNNKLCQMAYIEIASWCDSEVAYNFIRRLKVLEGEARLTHNSNEDWWPVQINTHYDGQLFIDANTLTFSLTSFVKEVSEVEDCETLTESDCDIQSFGEMSFGEVSSCEAFLEQKMYLEDIFDEKMYNNQEEIYDKYLSAETLSAKATYNQALIPKEEEPMCDQYLCDKYLTYQFLCAQ